MFSRPFRYRLFLSGLHVAICVDGDCYRPGMVLEDGGGRLVRVRYVARGEILEGWVPRINISPPPAWGEVAHRSGRPLGYRPRLRP